MGVILRDGALDYFERRSRFTTYATAGHLQTDDVDLLCLQDLFIQPNAGVIYSGSKKKIAPF